MPQHPGPKTRPATLQDLAASLHHGGDRESIIHFGRSSETHWSFRQLGGQVEALASGLAARGVGPGDAVGLCARNGPEWIAACLAILRTGATVVPIDTQVGEDDFRYMLENADLRHVFISGAVIDRLRHACEAAQVKLFLLDDGEEEKDAESWHRLMRDSEAEHPEVRPSDRAVLFYTSGTTGRPKGVPLSHRNLIYQVRMLANADLVARDERVLLPLPLHHVYPFVVGMLTPLALRVPLVLPNGFTGPQIVEACRRGNATMMIGVPRLYGALVAAVRDRLAGRGRIPPAVFQLLLRASILARRHLGLQTGRLLFAPLHRRFGPRLRTAVSGGAALDPRLAWVLEGLGWRVATGYGLTETSPILTFTPPGDTRFESSGPPLPGVELRIAPGIAETGGDEAPGAAPARESGGGGRPGEILVRGPGVFAGYQDMPEATARAFTGDGWFRTGDLGYLDREGRLHIAGRRSTLIVTGSGKNVQPDEVEEAYQTHPAIAEIAVFEREGGIAALVVPGPEARRTEDAAAAVGEAIGAVSRRLASYQRIGAFALTAEAIPRTRLGKPRRHLLPALYDRALRGVEAPAPEHRRPMALEEMSAEDRWLADDPEGGAVWALLREWYPDRRLTPDSDLRIDLGIDSIGWLNLTLEVAERTGVALDEAATGEMQTVRDLMHAVAQGPKDAAPAAGPLDDPDAALDERQRRWLQPLGALEGAVARALHAVNRAAVRTLFRLRFSGLENVPAEGPCILTPNHASYLDAFALAACLDETRLRETYWAGWTEILFSGPARRLFSRLGRAVPIDPRRATASSLAFGASALTRGYKLVWFPEGRRSPDGRLLPFRPGVGMLLERYRVPVVPVVIRGSHEAWPVGRMLPRLRPLSVRICAPVDARALAAAGRGGTEAERIADGLRRHIADLMRDDAAERVAV